MKKLLKKLLKPFRKARKQIPRVRYVDSDGVVRYANVDKLTVRVLVGRVKQLEERIVQLQYQQYEQMKHKTVEEAMQSTSQGLQN